MRHQVLFVVVALSGCRTPPPRGEPAPPPAALPPPPGEPPAASPSASAPPPAEDAGGRREVPKRTGTPGSTRGTIACGKIRCTAPGEICTWDEAAFAYVCGPAPRVDAPYVAPGVLCDDGTDCPEGRTCCETWLAPGSGQAACVPRPEVSTECRAELCIEGGARCPAGRTCVRYYEGQGFCEAPKGPATCAGGRRCRADEPICVRGEHGLACVADKTPGFATAPANRRWECTRQSDCNAGDRCIRAFGETELATYCGVYASAYTGSLVCDPRGPGLCGSDAACRAAYECSPTEGGPPWLGTWVPRE